MTNNSPNQVEDRITFAEAKKHVSEMNLINNFLFDSTLEKEDEAKVVAGNILKSIFNREFKDIIVFSQKQFNAIDTPFHSIRLDIYISENTVDKSVTATIYNMEMEDRIADKKNLPKRNRFYGALHDSKLLESGTDYDELPDFISITISSYDPFNAGDMCYVAKTVLTSHPNLGYQDGLTHIYLYCNGKPNIDALSPFVSNATHSKKLQEMLHYILTGEKPNSSNPDIDDIDMIVAKVKQRGEVTTEYMRQWERENLIAKDAKIEAKKEDALEMIRLGRKGNLPDETIVDSIRSIGLNDDIIDELFKKIDAESVVSC